MADGSEYIVLIYRHIARNDIYGNPGLADTLKGIKAEQADSEAHCSALASSAFWAAVLLSTLPSMHSCCALPSSSARIRRSISRCASSRRCFMLEDASLDPVELAAGVAVPCKAAMNEASLPVPCEAVMNEAGPPACLQPDQMLRARKESQHRPNCCR